MTFFKSAIEKSDSSLHTCFGPDALSFGGVNPKAIFLTTKQESSKATFDKLALGSTIESCKEIIETFKNLGKYSCWNEELKMLSKIGTNL